MSSFRLVMLGLGNWVDNGISLGCKLPSFHPVFTLFPSTFILFLPCSFLILLNLSLIHLFELFLWNSNFHMYLIQADSLFFNSFSFIFLRFGIVQCFVFLGFLLLLENFGLATPIPVGIRVLGVKTPLRA